MQKCLSRGAEELPESHLDIMKKKHEGNGLETVNGFDVRWRLISGKMASQESRLLLSKAVAIFHVSADLSSYKVEMPELVVKLEFYNFSYL